MRRTVALGVALALVMALTPAALAAPAAKGPPKGPVIGLVVFGQLTDPGYNPLALEGVKEAAAIIGAKIMTAEAKGDAAAARAISTVVRRGASVVVTVGFMLAEATRAVAQANPSVQFIGVDQWQGSTTIENLQALMYDQAQAGFLAGVVAGSVTSGIIGTVGGTDFNSAVLAYMNGYANGAAWVADVDPSVLVAFAGSYQDPAAGYEIANGMVDQGADVVFGVAGLSTLGVLEAACDRGVWGIGVDYDMWAQHPEYRDCTITSAELRIADTVSAALVRWSRNGSLEPGMFVNNAANNGITWSPIRNYEAPPALVAALHVAYAGLADGSIDPCDPIACETAP